MFYAIYLRPSRPDFMQTMTDEEKRIMQQHVAYWQKSLDAGVMHVFGPVMDPKGGYGLGIIEVENEAQLVSLIDQDPASKINRYEYYPMRAVTKPK
jgi:uncharacterized protein YciI